MFYLRTQQGVFEIWIPQIYDREIQILRVEVRYLGSYIEELDYRYQIDKFDLRHSDQLE